MHIAKPAQSTMLGLGEHSLLSTRVYDDLLSEIEAMYESVEDEVDELV